MFAYEFLNPPCDEWIDDRLPALCKQQIERVCKDILTRGENTRYQTIYDAIYELVEAEINCAFMEVHYE